MESYRPVSVHLHFFRLLGNPSVVSAWLKGCCNVSAVTIALVFNNFGGIFLWVVAFLTLRYFISCFISYWETSVNENLFPLKILSLIIRKLSLDKTDVLRFSIFFFLFYKACCNNFSSCRLLMIHQRLCLWCNCFEQYFKIWLH